MAGEILSVDSVGKGRLRGTYEFFGPSVVNKFIVDIDELGGGSEPMARVLFADDSFQSLLRCLPLL